MTVLSPVRRFPPDKSLNLVTPPYNNFPNAIPPVGVWKGLFRVCPLGSRITLHPILSSSSSLDESIRYYETIEY